jgi:hypothetical protein
MKRCLQCYDLAGGSQRKRRRPVFAKWSMAKLTVIESFKGYLQ